MARRLFIAGNWKMNHDNATTRQTIAELRPLVAAVKTVDIAVCPPFTSLATAVEAARGSNVIVGAQNVHWKDKGAYTGEISVGMLRELGVPLVILGHSERRQHFGETDKTVNDRLVAALGAGLRPIVCVGESKDQRLGNQTMAVVGAQVRGSLAGLKPEQMATVVLAYEPVWAIGTGLTATPAQAQEVHAHIRQVLGELFGAAVAAATRLQYGGSVNGKNVAELMGQPDVDGALVGGASLLAKDFAELVTKVA